MRIRLMRKAKTLFLTFGVVCVCMYVLLNTLSSEISLKNMKLSELENDKIQLLASPKHVKHEAFQDVFAAQGQRKQKTLLNNDYNPTGDNYAYEQNENNDNEINENKNLIGNLKHENDVKNVEHDTNQHHLNNKTSSYYRKEFLNGKDQSVDNDNDLDDDDDENDDLYDPNEEDEEYEYDDDDDDDDSENNNVENMVDNYHYDDATNAPFQPGDFGDVAGKVYYRKPKLKFAEVKEKNYGVVKMSIGEDDNPNKELIENGIFWSQYVENLIPRGKSYSEVTRQISELKKQVVKTLDKPGWDKCGRPMNGYAVLSDNTKLCVRYRQPHTSFIYGETLSFYLSRLLKMDNVPTVILAKTNSTSKQWRSVDISSLTWEEDKMVALIAWVDEINSGASSKAYIPPLLLEAYRTGKPVTRQVLQTSQLTDKSTITAMVQWGTMIVFDYLTGNYDRVASMQDAENRENDPKIIEESIRNLKKSASTGKLWLIDNECGLLDAYQLLKPYSANTRFTTFHTQMLQTMCLFELPFVQALRKLHQQPSPHKRLENFAISFEPYLIDLPKDKLYEKFSETFDKRLSEVIYWIQHCENLNI